MNERIKELYNKVVGDDKLNFDSYLAEKFAELIVQKCVKVCADRGKHHDSLYSAWANDCSERIGKHFGVGE
jgi:hypothetical protein